MSDISLNITKLQRLFKLLSGGLPKVKVGILSDTNQRTKDTLTNAQIGFTNEFGKMTGYPKIPPRSFIRMPLNLYFSKRLSEKKSVTGKELEKAIETGKTEQFAKKIGLIAEEVIQEAFETRGWGQWPKNAPYTIEQKGSDSPLIDTGQLRRAITSKVIK